MTLITTRPICACGLPVFAPAALWTPGQPWPAGRKPARD